MRPMVVFFLLILVVHLSYDFFEFVDAGLVSARELCRNWDTNAIVGHWSVTSKCYYKGLK